MNFEKCFDILNDRQNQNEHSQSSSALSYAPSSCPCLSALTTEHTPAVNSTVVKEESNVVAYEVLDTLELVEKFIRLQEERVAVSCYSDTHSTLRRRTL